MTFYTKSSVMNTAVKELASNTITQFFSRRFNPKWLTVHLLPRQSAWLRLKVIVTRPNWDVINSKVIESHYKMFLLFKKKKFGAKSNVREANLLSRDKKTINISDITDRTAVHLHDSKKYIFLKLLITWKINSGCLLLNCIPLFKYHYLYNIYFNVYACIQCVKKMYYYFSFTEVI